LTFATSLLAGCSWANFKGSVYESLRQDACHEQQRTARPDQRGSRPNSDCFPQGDARGMSAAQYDAERKRVLGKPDAPSAEAEDKGKIPAAADASGTVVLPEGLRSSRQ
jgi:hypothetical protein